ncbi:MAG: hypothetical protein L0Z55_07790 [Planctomycetes bacterium]|nr:hypothetical protein [Planctomycetota bacterium]
MGRSPAIRAAGLLVFIGISPVPCAAQGIGGELLLEAPYAGIAPEGIAHDPTDNSFWVTSFLDEEIQHYDAALNLLDSFPTPFDSGDKLGGIAYNPANDSLFILEPVELQIIEVDKTGVPFAGAIDLPIENVVNPLGQPVLRGMALHAAGNGGAGSLYIVETVGALIYEFDLAGKVIRTFEHPDDPDGFPGSGAGAPAGGIAVDVDEAGALIGIDLVGEAGASPAVHRVDPAGVFTGLSVPLTETGSGSVGGIARAPYVDPATGTLHDAFYGTDGSGAELFVVDASLPAIAELLDLSCSESGDDITIAWTSGEIYDAIIIERNGDLLATLPGAATSYLDADLPPAVYRYRVRGEAATLSSGALACSGTIGAGQVQALATLPEELYLALDLAEDAAGTLWISGDPNLIYNYSKELELIATFDGPFTGADDVLTGIAYRPETDTLLAFNAATLALQELELNALPTGDAVIAEIPIDPLDPPLIGAIEYDPGGNGGDGQIFAADIRHAVIYRIARDGALLGSFVHPDELALPTPDPSVIDTFCLGISGVPESGGGFDEIDIAGGSAWDQRTTRFLRVDPTAGTPLGFQLPTVDIDNDSTPRYLGLQNSTYLGEPVAFVTSLRAFDNHLMRVLRAPPPVQPLDYLACRQTGLEDVVEITFANHGPYDGIEVARDGTLIATLAGDADSFSDDGAGPGWHEYRLTPVVAGESVEPRECDLRVGVGAVLKRAWLHPAASPYQMTRDPADGSFLISVNSGFLGGNLYRFDSDLEYVETISTPLDPPWLVAALAIRTTPEGSQIWTISWEVPAPPLEPQAFEVAIQETDGTLIGGPTEIDIPGPPIGEALTYPAAMVHDPVGDTFFFLERNSDLFWQMNSDGELIGSFPHPFPPVQDFVFNLGLAWDPVRNTFTATTAGIDEHKITRAIGITPQGVATGEVIHLDDVRINPIYGLAAAGERLWVSGSLGGLPLIFELKAADALAPIEAVTCAETAPNEVFLAWEEPIAYDEILVRRAGVLIATIAPGTLTYLDYGVGAGPKAYAVSGSAGTSESAPSACSLVVAGGSPTFLRGDANGDGAIGLVDAIVALTYLFASGAPPACLDAVDADDSGTLALIDPLRVLSYLFVEGVPPAPPFPEEGADPTGDALGCEG